MSRKLHVTNLDLAIEDSDLAQLFAKHGIVRRAQVLPHRSLGSNTTTGLVEMNTDDEGDAAIAMLNGQEHWGHILSVHVASDVDHCEMFEPMNTPEPETLEPVRGPRPGNFGDRSGKGGSGAAAMQSPVAHWAADRMPMLTRDQLDVRLVDGDRLLLVHVGPDAEPHCRVLYRQEEVPMEIFTEYRNLGLIRSTGDPDVFM